MPFFIALLVFVVVTLAVFAAMSLFDQRKAQARVLRDRLSNVQKPAEQATPDLALLRDEVLSRIPAFDTWLRRSERVSASAKNAGAGKRGCSRRKLPHALRRVGRGSSPPSLSSPAAT